MPMLLNELQKQNHEIEERKSRLARMPALETRLEALEALLSKGATSAGH